MVLDVKEVNDPPVNKLCPPGTINDHPQHPFLAKSCNKVHYTADTLCTAYRLLALGAK